MLGVCCDMQLTASAEGLKKHTVDGDFKMYADVVSFEFAYVVKPRGLALKE